MDMCRACLSTDCEMLRINDDCLENYKLLTNLKIELDNDLPQSMCRNCWDSVDAFIDFRNKCITAEASLHDILNNVNAEIDTKQDLKILTDEEQADFESGLNVKQEPEDDDYYNDDYVDIDIKIESEAKATLKRKAVKTEAAAPKKRGRPRKDDAQKKKIKKLIGRPKKSDVPKLEKSPEYPCGLCDKSYTDRESLFAHLEKHKKGTTCSTCKEEQRPWPRLISHRVSHLPEGARCHVCWKMFRVDIYLEHHYLTHHYEGEYPGLQCKFCSKKLNSARKMKGHVWSQHGTNRYTCDYCKKGFPNKNNLRIHIIQHSTKMNYFCDKCSFSCKYSNNLRMHNLRMHTDVKVQCKTCYRFFENKLKMDKHTCIRSVMCPDCGKHFKHSSLLSRHLRAHSDERAYKCPRCPNSYKSRGNLNTHLLKHDNIRPFKCEYCNMRFFTSAVRQKHQRVHTGEKPFVCHICDKGFTGNHNLKIHMKVHGLNLVVKRGTENATIENPIFTFQPEGRKF